MPKLAAKDRKKVDKAEAVSGGFEPFAPGKYVGTLEKVEAKQSSAGNPMWVAEFTDITSLDDETMPGRLWYNLNLPTSDTPPEGYKPKNSKKSPEEAWKTYQDLCAGRIKAFFEAFGYEVDSDTDEFLGEKAVLTVGIQTINKGPRTGQNTNVINGVSSLDSVDGADAIGGDGDDDDF